MTDYQPHGCLGILVGLVLMGLVGLSVTLFLLWVQP